MNIVRFNPLHAPNQAPLGKASMGGLPQIKSVADSVSGANYNHLGHFATPNVLKAGHNTVHPGFKAVQKKIEGEGYSEKTAGAILASKTRHASAKAKRNNPRLKRVKG